MAIQWRDSYVVMTVLVYHGWRISPETVWLLCKWDASLGCFLILVSNPPSLKRHGHPMWVPSSTSPPLQKFNLLSWLHFYFWFHKQGDKEKSSTKKAVLVVWAKGVAQALVRERKGATARVCLPATQNKIFSPLSKWGTKGSGATHSLDDEPLVCQQTLHAQRKLAWVMARAFLVHFPC